RAVAAAALTLGLAAGLWTGLAGPVGATGRATPVDGSWRDASGHAFQLAGSLEGGFTVTAAATWTINKVCTLPQGTVVEKFTPLGGGKFEIRWLNVWVPMNPEAPGAKCEFVFDGGPATVTVSATAKAITISNCNSDACAVTGTKLTRATALPTTTAKPTTTATPATGKLVVSLFGMPNRYGPDGNKDGLVDMLTTPQQVSPTEWSARVYVHRPNADCDAGATYSWQVDGRIAELEATKTKCVFNYSHFNGLGRHRVAVAATNGSVRESGSGIVTLKDFLIVGLGDSNASVRATRTTRAPASAGSTCAATARTTATSPRRPPCSSTRATTPRSRSSTSPAPARGSRPGCSTATAGSTTPARTSSRSIPRSPS
ncbi:MAG TPA: hypothetical protein VIU44_15870, partial [Gaiellaceae bacterium]